MTPAAPSPDRLRTLPARRGLLTVQAVLPAVLLAMLPAVLLGMLLPWSAAAAQDFFPPPRLTEAQAAYHGELVRRAEASRLWERRYWHLLLHYRRNRLLPGVRSEADGLGFFLGRHGKVNPREELEATLARFFETAALPPGNMTAQCTFPARYHWLEQQLGFDAQRLPEQDCPRFQAWRASLDPGSVTLVYASYYFNVPASMFGHTLLRLDRKDRAEGERLLDYGVNYAAYTDPNDTAVAYAVKGLAGGYKGRFSLLPYYIKVRSYNDIENRDLWEYRLDFTPEQIDRLLLHTWEMGSTEFDYFFFDENCSYHLLSLLEAGNPALHLTDRFTASVLPVDTLRAVLRQPGLVSAVTYRPSRSSQMQHKMSFLSPEQRRLVPELADDPGLLESPAFTGLPERERALILESVADFHLLKSADSPEARQAVQPRLRPVLLARSRLHADLSGLGEPPAPPRAEEGHEASRIELGAGADRDRNAFVDVSLRPVMQDLMGDETGYPPNSEVLVFALRLRAEEVPPPPPLPSPPGGGEAPAPDKKLRLERLHLAKVVSLFPWTELERTFSWQFRVGWERTREGGLDCDPCVPFWVDGGIGMALQADWPGRTVVFSMLEPRLQFGPMFQRDYRFGVGLSLGVLVELGSRWRVGLIGRSTEYVAGEEQTTVGEASLVQRITLGRNADLRLEWNGTERYREGRLALGWYF
jgi:hypothetical protein